MRSRKDLVMNSPKQLTWVANLDEVLNSERVIPDGYKIRTLLDKDKTSLAALYLASYPIDIVGDTHEALDEMECCFSGEYGKMDFSASPIALQGNCIVAAIMTVLQAPWNDTPPGPFIIEVMVHPLHRRHGLAEGLISNSARGLMYRGRTTLGLRVMSDNTAALKLYGELGFVSWIKDDLMSS